MEETDAKTSGMSGAINRLGRTLIGALHTRLELFGLELQEEMLRLVTLLAWTAAVIFFAVLAVLCFTIALVLVCPESARPYVLAGFGLLYATLTWRGIVIVKRQLRDRPPPWSGTVGELKKDAEWVQSRM